MPIIALPARTIKKIAQKIYETPVRLSRNLQKSIYISQSVFESAQLPGRWYGLGLCLLSTTPKLYVIPSVSNLSRKMETSAISELIICFVL